MKHCLLLLSTLPIFACAEKSYSTSDMASVESDANNELSSSQRSFRIDVYPSDAFNDILPQSFPLDGITDYSGLEIDLQPTVSLSGNLQGYAVHPTSNDIVVPGENSNVEGRIELFQFNSISSAVGYSDSLGNYEISVPAGEYDMMLTPLNPENLPFEHIEDFQLYSNEIVDVDFGSGRPIFGQIMAGSTALTGATIQVLELYSDTPSPKFYLEADGEYRIRVPLDQDEFRLLIESQSNDIPIPTIETTIQTTSEEEFIEFNLDIGELAPVTVRGNLKHPQGDAYSERALIRITAVELFDNEGTLVIETNNDSNGGFRADLLPGRWVAHFIPPFGEDNRVSPTEIEIIVEGNSDIQLGNITLQESVNVSGVVYDPQGQPTSGVLISCKEVDFDEHVYSTYTDADGRFDFLLPPYPCNATLTPIHSKAAIQNFLLSSPSTEQFYELRLISGTEISGTLLFESKSIPFALIEIRDDENELLATTLSDNEGNFELRLSLVE